MKNRFVTFTILMNLFSPLMAHQLLATKPEAGITEITLRHFSTTHFPLQGVCSAGFFITSQMGDGDAGDVEIEMSFLDQKNKTIYRGVINTSLTDSTAGRGQDGYIEASEVCSFPLETRVVITKATSKIGGKKFDLIKLGKIHPSDFKRYPISISH